MRWIYSSIQTFLNWVERNHLDGDESSHYRDWQGFFNATWAMKKRAPGCLGWIGDCYPLLEGLIISHYRNPYQTARIQWKTCLQAMAAREGCRLFARRCGAQSETPQVGEVFGKGIPPPSLLHALVLFYELCTCIYIYVFIYTVVCPDRWHVHNPIFATPE